MRKLFLAIAAAAVCALPAGAETPDKTTLAFVTNSSTNFWRPAEAGVRKAQSELPNYRLVFRYLKEPTVAAQTRLLDELVGAGVSGIVVSPVDTKDMVGTLDRIAGQATLFTTDSDAPSSKRVAYFGSSNVQAGKQAGQLLRRALPGGGKCMGFIGLLRVENAADRIAGVREALKGSNVELVDVLADDFDHARARSNVADTLARPDINCMVGFYDYNAPIILDAVRAAGQLGRVRIVAFDEDPVTLGGVKDGTIVGTVVQQAYEWGYLGMTALARYMEGRKSAIPPDGRVILPTRIIDKDNVDAYWTGLKAMLCCLPPARETRR
ncbi:substrate-binding domain-containing protein [Reyranella sp.]|uniref:substrate-binding domain-containing protein n=1 Tax=Reyranella sp. TaxID=1929291 RepID=UPI003BAD92F0